MKLLIFGSTGGTGRELVKQALDVGHEVTAFARNSGKMDVRHERLTVVTGDITDAGSINSAVPGHDVVISALGSPGLGKSTELSDGTRRIIAAMESSGVERLIFESTVGVGDSSGHGTAFARWFFFPVVIRNILDDKEIQERIIRESSLDWTIVRPGRLTNGPKRNIYREGDAVNGSAVATSISRADVAEFMLRQVTDTSYIHKSPAVSY